MLFDFLFKKKKIIEKKYKIVLIGDCETGKTHYLHKYIFEYNDNKIYEYTIGATNYSKTYFLNNYNKKINLNFIDVGGKKRYNDLIPLFIKNSSFILIFYDINNIESFKYAQFLYENYINNKNDYIIFFIGNYNKNNYLKNNFKNNIFYIPINTNNNFNVNTILDTILLKLK